MKTKIAAIGFILFVLFAQTFAQKKVVALKFDEFSRNSDDASDSESISARMKRFAIELKRQSQAQAVIIGYDKRKQYYGNDYWIGDNAILRLQRELERAGISEKRIVRIVGGVRENESYELWLLPKGAETPQPRAELKQSDVIYCPYAPDIEGVRYTFDRNKTLEFSGRSYPENIRRGLSYEWELSAGKLTEGQGTERIKVDASQAAQNYLVVKLNVKGLPLECDSQATHNITFAEYPFKIAEFKDEGENLKWYPIELFATLGNDPNLEGKIYVYGSRNRRNSIFLGIRKLKMAFRFGQFSLDKVTIENGGFREDLTFEMWIYPKDSPSPKRTPTVDEIFINTSKQTSLTHNRK